MEKQNDQVKTDLIVSETSVEESYIQFPNKDKYSIFNYLKKHPAAVIACFSSMVAVITFMSQFLVYIVSKNTLTYWNFDPTYASFDNDSLLYSAIAAIVYVIITSFATTWFLKTSDVYIERKRYYLIDTLFYKEHSRICNRQNQKLEKLKLIPNIDKDEVFEIEDSINKTRQRIKELKKETKHKKRKAHFFFLINVLPIFLLVCIFDFVLSFMIASKEHLLESMFVICVIHISTYYFMFGFEKRSQIKKNKLKKDIQSKNIDDVINKNQCEKEYPLFALFIKGDGVSNSAFITQAISIFLVLIFLVFAFALGSTNSQKAKTDIQIANIDGEQYAVVYYSDDTYYLEKVCIENRILTIFTNEQRILSTSDISFSVQRFEKVIKIDGDKIE